MVQLLRAALDFNMKLSRAFDRLFLPARWREDGNKWYRANFIPRALASGGVLYDLGGGSQPAASLDDKIRHGLTVVGLDIDAAELDAAPPGIYDRKIVADLCAFRGEGAADSIICQATLEHVPDTAGAMRALASSLKPGGRVYIFAPSRNALFARLNLLLPEGVKQRVLFSLFPAKATGHDGFKAYYDRCTPRDIEQLARDNGLEVEERRLFWISSYFGVFFPAWLVWRAWQGAARLALGDNAAETFAYCLRKPDERPQP